jgi:hypothetical protein
VFKHYPKTGNSPISHIPNKIRYVANVVEKLKKPTNSIPYPYSLYASTVSTVPYQQQQQAPPPEAPLLYSALASSIPNAELTFPSAPPSNYQTTTTADHAPSAPPLEDLLESPPPPVAMGTPPPLPPKNTPNEPPKQEESLLSSMFTVS